MYIVYKTTCTLNNKIYIGVHKTESDEIFDGYYGCGINMYNKKSYRNPKTEFQKALVKYGFKNFKRETIARFDNREEAYALEAKLVNKDFVASDNTYNARVGGYGGIGNESFQPKPIYMYDVDGNFEKKFNSITEMLLYLNVFDIAHVSRAIKLNHLFHGHQLSYDYIEQMPKHEKHIYEGPRIGNIINHEFEKKPIARFDIKTGEILEVFRTLIECRNAGYANAKKVIIGERKKCKGFGFRYLTNDEIKKYNISIKHLNTYEDLHKELSPEDHINYTRINPPRKRKKKITYIEDC